MKGPVISHVAMLAMITMALVMVHPTEAISCGELAGMLSPCISYLRSGGSPSANCCSGAKKVQGAIQSQADRRTACNCAKSAAGQLQVRADAATGLPGKCGISVNVPMNPNVDCNR
ncbi:putative plant lipid transfer protein/Par allergen [Helianthus annuus]|nr:putative plant non-specific lipid-transfer protein/Par allergen [Helianthus annuus]KAJ0447151.1 putative plant non-specific lipid-transfer protein/Par allergen [Helianthus annuus]KAJ0632059.1 putative plant non-specific lipid-transfer protein/Par allergen [Helianthus annuus]KAJ0635938.1 putative plant non-specific lipid-transfer protein/Par allergen [Helianthus annuus]KAJ0825869.1 putative plant lipid transfer protein/Par allergen [Helianthus annuus]